MVVVGAGLLVLDVEHQESTGNFEDPGDALCWVLVPVTHSPPRKLHSVLEAAREHALLTFTSNHAILGGLLEQRSANRRKVAE